MDLVLLHYMINRLINWMMSKFGANISGTPLAEKKDVLFAYVRDHYAPHQMAGFNAIVKRVTCEAPANREAVLEFYKGLLPHYSQHGGQRAVFVRVMAFDLFDYLTPPDMKMAYKSAKYDLNPHYRCIVEYYQNLKLQAGTDSSDRRVSMMANFFLDMMERGIDTIRDIEEEDVLAFAKEHQWANRSYRKMANQISECESFISDGECLRIASYFPKLGGRKNDYVYLTKEEEDLVEDALFRSDKLSLLQKALGILVWLSGIRRIDVRNLRLSDVHWGESRISYIQIKTGVPAEIPLVPVLGNAIYDYIQQERPRCDVPYLFVRISRSGKTFKQINMYSEINKIYEIAGIDMERGRLGPHLLRHHFATEELHSGVDRSVIANALGHSYPSAVNQYTDIDETRMQECSLDISCYPVQSKLYVK